MVLSAHDAPQPDVTLLKLRPDGYPTHPRAADLLLVVEVADTTLAYDRDIKLPLYARAGVPEVWLVDLTADRIAVYRTPTAGTYSDTSSASRGDALTLLHFPNLTISTGDILG